MADEDTHDEPLGERPAAEPMEDRNPAAELEDLQARLLELQRQKLERQVQNLADELEFEQKEDQVQELGWPEDVRTLSHLILFEFDSIIFNLDFARHMTKSKAGSILAGVTRAAKASASKASSSSGCSNGSVSASPSHSGGPAYFAFKLSFPPNYPFKPPKITVLSHS